MSQTGSLESKIREYLKLYDGSCRQLADEEMTIIDALFHDDILVMAGEKTIIEKPVLVETISGFLELGSKVTLLKFEISDDEKQFEFQIYCAGASEDGRSFIDRSIGSIKDGKIIKMKPAFDDTLCKELSNNFLFELKFRSYFNLYNRVSKKFGDEQMMIVDTLFAYENGQDNIFTRLTNINEFVEQGFTVKLVQFNFLDGTKFEYRLMLSGKGILGEMRSFGTVKDHGKLASFIAPKLPSTYKSSKIELLQQSMQTNPPSAGVAAKCA